MGGSPSSDNEDEAWREHEAALDYMRSGADKAGRPDSIVVSGPNGADFWSDRLLADQERIVTGLAKSFGVPVHMLTPDKELLGNAEARKQAKLFMEKIKDTVAPAINEFMLQCTHALSKNWYLLPVNENYGYGSYGHRIATTVFWETGKYVVDGKESLNMRKSRRRHIDKLNRYQLRANRGPRSARSMPL